jgi:hypothetical protein
MLYTQGYRDRDLNIIVPALLLQKWLHKRATVLRYTYIALLFLLQVEM